MVKGVIMEIPVFLFLGFLESGKTKFIQETMEDPRFDNGEKTLILSMEEGIEEYDESKFKVKNFAIEKIEEQEDLTEENLVRIAKETKAQRIIVEYNGMWLLDDFFNVLPPNWEIAQIMTFADSNTILNYNANMRQQTFDKITMTELVVFNRFKRGMDKMPYHKLVRSISRRPQIVYEYEDGTAEQDDIEDPLPFDVNADVIVIEDKDYALWYRDVCEEPSKYEGKTVKFKGIVAVDKKLPKDTIVVGRHIMTCCEADISYSGLLCKYKNDLKLKSRDWVVITAKINVEYTEVYEEPGPVLTVEKIVVSVPPEEQVATFW